MEYLLFDSVPKFCVTRSRLRRRRGDELEALSRGPIRPRGGGGRRHIHTIPLALVGENSQYAAPEKIPGLLEMSKRSLVCKDRARSR